MIFTNISNYTNFKPKAKKKFKMNKKSTMTLDGKHNEKMKFSRYKKTDSRIN